MFTAFRPLVRIACCLLLSGSMLFASTTHVFGTIIAVDHEGGTFVILVVFFDDLSGRGVECRALGGRMSPHR